jgi:cytoskeleton protein RodZ
MAKGNDTKESRGERLRRLRKAKGLTLEEVHRRTNIHITILKAIEGDTMDEISPAYAKGLLKIYCNFLGVNPKDFIKEYTKEDEPKKSDMPDSSKVETPAPLDKPRLNISVIKKQIKIKPIILVICLLLLGIAAFKFGKSISTTIPKPKPRPKPQVSSPMPVITEPTLDIRAKEDCWLEVKTDGKTVFRNILKKGQFERWEAKQRIEFSVGNAGGVDVEVNGKLFSPLGRRGQVIKNITITKQGLRVPK